MGKSSISYKRNNIDFKEARDFYYAPANEASSINLFNVFGRPKFKDVIDIEEFDSNEYTFKFNDNQFFQVEAEAKHWK